MKFNIVKYFESGDIVYNKRTKQTGTVIKSGHNPIVQFENIKWGGNENRRVLGKYLKFVNPVFTFVNRKVRRFL